MSTPPRKRYPTPFGDHPATYTVSWIGMAFALFWPLLLGPAGIVIEVIWLALVLGTWRLAATGRRKARRRSAR